MDNNKIALFDSGVGGLSILEYLKENFPDNEYIYLKDSENFPYGIKTKEELNFIGKTCITKLLAYNPQTIIIACNTMCCNLEIDDFNTSVIKINEIIVEQVKKNLSQNKKILLLCTQATKDSGYYQKCLKDYNLEVKAAPELVLMVETNTISINILKEFLVGDYDGIILGCTHFNYLYTACREILGDKVVIFTGLELLKEKIKKEN